jgi:membrane protein
VGPAAAVADAEHASSGLTTQPAANTIAVAVGAILMLFAAAGAFRSLRKALNAMWNVEPAPAGRDARKIGWIVFYNVMLTLMVIGLALFIAVLIGLSTLWGTLSNRLAEDTPSAEVLFRSADFFFTLALTVCAFALLFKVVPLARIARRDLWLSATLTAVLFGIGKLGFGIYMSYSSTGSLYGAAASLVIFLIFVYYSAMIMFFGAEFAQVYGRRHGRSVKPRKGARRVARPSTPDSAI